MNDTIWSQVADIDELPQPLVERMRHYFLTYKLFSGAAGAAGAPGAAGAVSIDVVYGKEHAERVILAAIVDYDAPFAAEGAG